MRKKIILLIIILVITAVAASLVYIKTRPPQTPTSNTKQTLPTSSTPTHTPTPTTPAATPTPTAINPLLNAKTSLDYPMPDFASRIKLNFFGSYFSAATTPRNQYPDHVCPNNTLYTGYHAADDLEITPTEQNIDVSVYAISDGVVRFAGHVTGYGGLIIIGFTYQSQSYTALYGHIDIRTMKVSSGQAVTQGEILANLAPACSTYSGNNRKHLHFGIHSGSVLDENGYVPTKSGLNGWIDPRQFFGV